MCLTQILLKANRLFHLIVLMKDRDKKIHGKPTYRITWEDYRIAHTICAIEMVLHFSAEKEQIFLPVSNRIQALLSACQDSITIIILKSQVGSCSSASIFAYN